MKRLAVTICALWALSANAGETLLGTLTSTGADITNSTTAVPFYVPPTAQLTVQCDGSAYFITDDATAVTSARGVKLSADTIFPTSTGSQVRVTISGQSSAVLRVISASGTVNCKVWQRRGNE